MNEQVNKLIGKAFDKAIPYTWDSLDYTEVEKLLKTFAELFIQEATQLTPLDYKSSDYYMGWIDYQAEILEHFES